MTIVKCDVCGCSVCNDNMMEDGAMTFNTQNKTYNYEAYVRGTEERADVCLACFSKAVSAAAEALSDALVPPEAKQ